MDGKTHINFLLPMLQSFTELAVIDSATEITRMTLAGKKTLVQVYSLEELEHIFLLCKMETNLYRLDIKFPDYYEYDYFMFMLVFSEIIKLQSLKVCIILFSFSCKLYFY